MPGLIKRIFLFVLFSYMCGLAYSQIGIGVNPPNPSAILHVQDTARGLLIPRMTAAQRINIQNPAEGLMVYQTDSPAGFWYFRSGQWVNTFPSNGGKNTLILADSITDAEAQLKIANEAGPNTQEIRILRCSNLTTVDLSMLTNSVVLIDIEDNTVLQNVNIDNLKKVEADVYINNCPQLTALNASSLGMIGQAYVAGNGLGITNTGMPNINFPVLKGLTGQILIQNNPALTNINLPQLEFNKSMLITDNALLASISFHALKGANAIYLTAPALALIDFQSLKSVNSLTLTSNQLQSISFPAFQSCQTLTFTCPQLSTLSAPSLVSGKLLVTGGPLSAVNLNSLQNTQGITITATGGTLSSISFPSLQTVNLLPNNTAVMNISGIGTLSFPLLHEADAISLTQVSSLSAPLLDTVKSTLDIHSSPSLPTLTFNALKRTGGISINNCGITSLSFPSLISNNNPQFTGGLGINTNPNLTSISWPNFQAVNNNYSALNNNKLPSSEVNAILAKFRATPFSSGGILLRQTPAAPPTGQGIIDKNYLMSEGVSVDTD